MSPLGRKCHSFASLTSSFPNILKSLIKRNDFEYVDLVFVFSLSLFKWLLFLCEGREFNSSVCFVHRCIPSIQNSAWYVVNTPFKLVDYWINGNIFYVIIIHLLGHIKVYCIKQLRLSINAFSSERPSWIPHAEIIPSSPTPDLCGLWFSAANNVLQM